jgi:hypothetical protein
VSIRLAYQHEQAPEQAAAPRPGPGDELGDVISALRQLTRLWRRRGPVDDRGIGDLAEFICDRAGVLHAVLLELAEAERETARAHIAAALMRDALIEEGERRAMARMRGQGPQPRHSRPTQSPLLGVLKGGRAGVLVPVAAALGTVARHAAKARTALGAIPHAAALATGSVAVAAVAATVAVLPGSPPPPPQVAISGSSSSAPAYDATGYPVPAPSSSLRFAAYTRPRTDANRAKAVPAGLPLPPAMYGDPPAAVPSAPPSPAQAPPPAVLEMSTTALDLTGSPQAVITLSATSGSGWVSWTVSADGTDLDFSATHGVLAAGESCQITVSLDPDQDGSTMETFSVDGQSVTVTLPPLAVPSPVVSVSPGPTVLPS